MANGNEKADDEACPSREAPTSPSAPPPTPVERPRPAPPNAVQTLSLAVSALSLTLAITLALSGSIYHSVAVGAGIAASALNYEAKPETNYISLSQNFSAHVWNNGNVSVVVEYISMDIFVDAGDPAKFSCEQFTPLEQSGKTDLRATVNEPFKQFSVRPGEINFYEGTFIMELGGLPEVPKTADKIEAAKTACLVLEAELAIPVQGSRTVRWVLGKYGRVTKNTQPGDVVFSGNPDLFSTEAAKPKPEPAFWIYKGRWLFDGLISW